MKYGTWTISDVAHIEFKFFFLHELALEIFSNHLIFHSRFRNELLMIGIGCYLLKIEILNEVHTSLLSFLSKECPESWGLDCRRNMSLTAKCSCCCSMKTLAAPIDIMQLSDIRQLQGQPLLIKVT